MICAPSLGTRSDAVDKSLTNYTMANNVVCWYPRFMNGTAPHSLENRGEGIMPQIVRSPKLWQPSFLQIMDQHLHDHNINQRLHA